MNTKMTKRDKKLLITLGAICIFLVYAFFIARPLVAANKSLALRIESNDMYVEQLHENARQLPFAQEENELLREKLAAKTADLYPRLKSQEIDKLLTENVRNSGLLVKKLQILMPEQAANLTAFGDAAGVGSNPDAKDGLWIAQVELQVTGSEGNIDLLLDQLTKNMPGVFVRNIGWSIEERESGLDMPSVSYDTATLQLGVLMSGKE